MRTRCMKMLVAAAAVLAAVTAVAPGTAQGADNDAASWGALDFLIGEWSGEEGGAPGQGTTTFSFATELGGDLLVRRHRAEYPATRKRVGTVQQDLLVITRDESEKPSGAVYFDTDHHVIHFVIDVSDDGRTITLTSEAQPSVPRYRLNWVREGDREMAFTISMASSQTPDDFQLQSAGKAKRK